MKNRFLSAVFPILCAAAVLTGACRPEVELPVTDSISNNYHVNGNSYRDIAFAFWQGVNLNYVFWDIEPVGLWDDMLDEYLPKIDALGTWDPNDNTKNDQFVEYLEGMAAPLHDGHFSAQFSSQQLGRSFYPQEARVDARFGDGYEDNANPAPTFYQNDWSGEENEYFPNYINWNFVEKLIIPKYLTGEGTWERSQVEKERDLLIAQGKINITGTEGHIAYLYFNKFHLNETMKKETTKTVTNLLNAFWADLRDPQCRGVIFDMRGNTGGYNYDIEYLIRPLLTGSLHFANMRAKKSEGRLSYTPWIPYTISPDNPIPNAGKIPVVALINDYSISCGELLPLAVRAMPRGYLIGTTTWGATGPRFGNDNPNALNGGSFTVTWPSGSLNVVQAGYQTRGKNLENYEGIGIEPDLRVQFNWEKFTHDGKYDQDGIDDQLEAAIKYIEESAN
jgi:hypothetical protein